MNEPKYIDHHRFALIRKTISFSFRIQFMSWIIMYRSIRNIILNNKFPNHCYEFLNPFLAMQKQNPFFYVSEELMNVLPFHLIFIGGIFFSSFLFSDGEHTSVKTVVTSKVGGLAGFITKKDKCIGCKTVLQEQG